MACGAQSFRVRRKRQSGYFGAVARKAFEFPARLYVPQARGEVAARRGQHLIVGREGQPVDVEGMPRERVQQLTVRQTPLLELDHKIREIDARILVAATTR